MLSSSHLRGSSGSSLCMINTTMRLILDLIHLLLISNRVVSISLGMHLSNSCLLTCKCTGGIMIGNFTLVFGSYFSIGLLRRKGTWRSWHVSFGCYDICWHIRFRRTLCRLRMRSLISMSLLLDRCELLLSLMRCWSSIPMFLLMHLLNSLVLLSQHLSGIMIGSFTLVFSSDFCIGLLWSRHGTWRSWCVPFGCYNVCRNIDIVRRRSL